MARPFDVCIRGGGITGRTLALLLAQERLRVALVVPAPQVGSNLRDQSGDPSGNTAGDPSGNTAGDPSGHSDVRAYALNRKSRDLLESLRCWPAPAHATPVLTMQVQGDDGGEVIFNAAEQHTDALAWIVDVPVLEAQLAQATQFKPQIELFDQPQAATLTVVCEGKNSQSRAEFGVEFDVTPYSQRAIAARLVCDQPHQHNARQWFAKGSILGVLPLGETIDGFAGNSVAIVWSVEEARAAELVQMDADAFCQAVQEATGSVYGALRLTSERHAWPLQLARAERWVGPGWALAGDAAHTVHPLSGQGLNLGLADVAELASLIARRDYWRSVADEKLLRQYERARKTDAAALGSVTDGLQRLFGFSGNGWQTLRNVGMNGFARSGLLKAWVARRAMGV
jgi:2-polyprenyl-6-methoxyphenol hydroxylase-like FAD-dependent oxidoreductase